MLCRKMILTFIAAALQIVMPATVRADLITITDAEQFVGAGIGYKTNEIDNRYIDEIIPDPPQRLGDADLNISIAQYGISLSGSLTSVFEEGRFTVNGSSTASSKWGNNPYEADDVHGGSGASFVLHFTKGSTQVYLHITGQISVATDRYPNLHPEETFTYVSLSTDDGGTLTQLWQVTLDGQDEENSLTFEHGLWLESGQNYVLKAYTETGTTSDPEHTELNSRTAAFSLAATIDESDSSDRYFFKDYFPLTEGITWNYLQSYADGHKNYEVFCIGGTEQINDTIMHKRWQFDSGELYDHDYSYKSLSWTKEGLKLYKIVYSDGPYSICDPPLIQAPVSIRIGETVKNTCTMTEYDAAGNIIGSWPYGRELMLDGIEDVKVLAGSFAQCLKFSAKFIEKENESQVTIWLAPGIGPVKSIFSDNEGNELISLTIQGKTYCPTD
jgi:hypothetical protein